MKTIVAIFFLILLGAALMASDPAQQIDFKNITLPNSPNYFLLCPKDYCNVKSNETSPIFNYSIVDLDSRFQNMVNKQKHITIVQSDAQNHQYTYIQRTPLLRFPDTINVKLIALSDNQSTLAIMSQSKYGYSDLGTNQRRINYWLSDLNKNESM